MGLLDKLWDDVVAGPQPDSGLGRLRKGPRMQDEILDESTILMADRRRSSEFQRKQEEARRVTQSITIAKPPPLDTSMDPECGSAPSTPGSFASSPLFSALGSPRGGLESDPSTPGAVSSPSSRFSGLRPGNKKVLQKFASERFEKSSAPGTKPVLQKVGSEKLEKASPSSPTVYDWVLLSALDR